MVGVLTVEVVWEHLWWSDTGFLCLLCPCVLHRSLGLQQKEDVWLGSTVKSDVGLAVVL